MLERRFIKSGQMRAKDGSPGIEGYASVFNEAYDMGWGLIETIKPGAFTRALREKQDVRCLFNHDANNLLGRSKAGTLRMSQDKTGLHFDCDLDPEMSLASDVQRMIQRGDLDGCSFAFQVTKQTWREEKDPDGRMISYRDIEDVDLFDVGPVTYPAYEGTSVGERSNSVAAAALWPNGVPAEIRSHVPGLAERADAKTKTVDGEELKSDAFLIVGDPEKTDTWHLPWKFSTEEKTKSHLRDALARFDQVEGVDEETKKKAYKKLVRLCKKYGIDVSDEEKKSLRKSFRDDDSINDDGDECGCDCASCVDGDCEECSAEDCSDETCRCDAAMSNRSWRNKHLARIAVATRQYR